MVPKRAAARDLAEAEDLLDTAVAIGRDDQHAPRQLVGRRRRKANDDVVVELALRPVFDEVVAAKAAGEVIEKGAEHQLGGKIGDDGDHPH
jgi:hypothetical protein